jgi:hypothetical protein
MRYIQTVFGPCSNPIQTKMNRIRQYQKILEIKPEYHVLRRPFEQASQKRFIFNVHEMNLWLGEDGSTYLEEPDKSKGPKRGGDNEEQKIQIALV